MDTLLTGYLPYVCDPNREVVPPVPTCTAPAPSDLDHYAAAVARDLGLSTAYVMKHWGDTVRYYHTQGFHYSWAVEYVQDGVDPA